VNQPTAILARGARILCAVTCHYVANRLRFLAQVLRSLAEFPVAEMTVVIVTNTFRQEDLAQLGRLCSEILSGKSASIRSYRDLHHPFDLAWCHKAIISEEVCEENHGRYTHFIYLEDDIELSFTNFCYFVEYREILRSFGLLPAFVRVEYSAALGGFVASDAFWPVYVPVQSHIRLGGTVLVNMPNPYMPMATAPSRTIPRCSVRPPSSIARRAAALCPPRRAIRSVRVHRTLRASK
jgi:hypothetical protein